MPFVLINALSGLFAILLVSLALIGCGDKKIAPTAAPPEPIASQPAGGDQNITSIVIRLHPIAPKSIDNGDSGKNIIAITAPPEPIASQSDDDGKKIIAIAAGDKHSFAIDSDGKVYAAGYNKYGQLGLGDETDRDIFVKVWSLKSKKIIALAIGGYHSFAIDEYGKVYATGSNGSGQLGLGEVKDRNEFTEVSSLGGKKIVAIAAGNDHSFAIDEYGKVYAVGYNHNGQLGLYDATSRRKVFTEVTSLGDNKIIAIAAGEVHSLALTSDGKVYATGYNYNGQLGLNNSGYSADRKIFAEVSSLSGKNIIAIAAGEVHSLALTSDGKVYAAGSNGSGQIGLGDSQYRKVFTEVWSLEGKNIIAIAAGYRYSLAVDSDGKVYATGSNKYGQLGLDDVENHGEFTEVSSLSGITAISAGQFHSHALDNGGKLYAAGWNNYGQLGLGDSGPETNRELFTELPSKVAPVAASSDPIASQSTNNDAKKIIAITAGNKYSFALANDGKVYAAGWNAHGQLGLGDNLRVIGYFTEVLSINGKKITALAAGETHSIALDKDGKVYASGWNNYGQLGLGDLDKRNQFVAVSSLKGKKIAAIAAGHRHSFILDSDGKVYAAGHNSDGQLGLGDNGFYSYRKVFTEVWSLEGKNIIAIVAGGYHSIAIDSDGKVYATGDNEYGQLGLDDVKDRNKFIEISSLSGKKITAIAAGSDHSFALDEYGKVYSTGDNNYGQLGLGDRGKGTNRKVFTEVTSLSGKKIIAIAAGYYLSLALDSEGKVYETGAFAEVSSLKGKKIIAIAVGHNHAFALDEDGKIYAKGWNDDRQLGLGGNGRNEFTEVKF